MVEAVSYTGSRYPGRGIGWSISQRRKSEVLYDRSRSGRPYLLRQAPCPRASHFPWLYIPQLRRKESKGKKVRSCTVAHAPAVRIFYGRLHVNSESLAALSGMTAVALPWVSPSVPHQPFPFGCLGLCHGTIRSQKKEWSHPVRQDKTVPLRPRA
jgi:hypothetical protein